MKVIFLDIDGVLNSHAYDRRRDRNARSYIDESRMPLVKEIVEATEARIVLSSSWRAHWDRQKFLCDEHGLYVDKVLKKFGLSIFDKTPDLGIFASRQDEINKWLNDTSENIESFVIIDDYADELDTLSEYLVTTDPVLRLGLEQEHVKRAIEILNGVKRA